MTYQVRLQSPENLVSEKTTTKSRAVADYAFCDLLHRYVGRSVAAAMTQREGSSKPINIMYIELTGTCTYHCQRCDYSGAFIDDGTTCPNCKLVQ